MNGHIYIIRGNADRFKIGFSVDPISRLGTLQISNPDRLILEGTIPGTQEQERQLHLMLDPWRVRGEWFERCPAIEHIISVATKTSDPPALSPIGQIIEDLGGATKAAEKLKLASPSVVLNWRRRGSIPARYVLAVSEATGIEPHIIRPDVFTQPEQAA